MKIIRLLAENVKRIRAVDIHPDGAVIQITGKNGSGKSSTLDCIEYALAGGKHLPTEPIRRGAKSARIKLDLGEVVVTRKFTPTGSTLVVEGANGARFPSPQRMLDDLLGAISFDPLEFSRMDARKQFDMLRSIVKLDVNLDALAGLNKRDFEERTEVNRGAKALRAQADGIIVPAQLEGERVDIDALIAEMESAANHNADIEKRKANRENAAQKILLNRHQAEGFASGEASDAAQITQRAQEAVRALQDQITLIEERAASDLARLKLANFHQITRLNDEASDLEQKLLAAGELPAPIDTAAVRLKIEQGRTLNAAIERRQTRRNYEVNAAKLEAKAKALTEAIDAREKVKADAITTAKMPIDDITFGEELVLYKALPFSQASSAEQLRVSVAIAMAANPKLKVLRIKDGSLLDEDGMRLLSEMAEAADYQVWIETVHANGPIAVEMLDGAVVGAPEPVAEEDAAAEAPERAKKPAVIEELAGPSSGAAE